MPLPETVVFEETGEERAVVRYCKRCGRCWAYENVDSWEIVSPAGTAHVGADYGETLCGIDATRAGWWHRL